MGNSAMNVSGLLLAGGRSRRLGEDKRLIKLDGKPLITHSYEKLAAVCDEVLVLIAHPEDEEKLKPNLPFSARFVPDQLPNEGPMGALISGMEAMKFQTALLLAVDLPRMSSDFLNCLIQYAIGSNDQADVVVPVSDEKLQITVAIYQKRCLESLKHSFASGERAIHHWAKNSTTAEIIEPVIWSEWGSEEIFFNLNDLGDLERLSDCH